MPHVVIRAKCSLGLFYIVFSMVGDLNSNTWSIAVKELCSQLSNTVVLAFVLDLVVVEESHTFKVLSVTSGSNICVLYACAFFLLEPQV